MRKDWLTQWIDMLAKKLADDIIRGDWTSCYSLSTQPGRQVWGEQCGVPAVSVAVCCSCEIRSVSL